MNKNISVALALLTSLIVLPAMARERQLLELTTRDFTLYSALGEKQTRYFATNMMAFDRVVTSASGAAARRGAGPTRIFLISAADWRDYFQPGANVLAFFTDDAGVSNDLVIPADGDRTESYRSIFHEYSHFIMRTQFSGYCPPWFDEGLAELLSTAQFREDRIVLPAPRGRLYDLAAGPWIPASTLFKVSHSSPEYRSHALAPSFYAQSWLVMNYAFVVNPPFLRQAVEYVLRLNRGEPQEAAAQAAFKRSFDEIDRELRAYAAGRTFRNGEILSTTERTLTSAPIRRLTAPESARVLGELGLRVPQSASRTEPLLLEAIAGQPTDARALAAHANVLAKKKDAAGAERLLAQVATSADRDQPDVAVAVGNAHYVLAMQRLLPDAQASSSATPAQLDVKAFEPNAKELQLARDAYDRALRTDPENLAAAHGYALSCLSLRECFDESITALTRAQQVAPSSWVIAYDLASANGFKGRLSASLEQWQLVARLARVPEVRDEALSIVRKATAASAAERVTADTN
jgi:tetratricopeptide (TPR) repeat protein